MSEWQPIETAPRDGTVVLVCGHGSAGYYVADAKWDTDEEAWCLFDQPSDDHVWPSHGHTHWMPLPEPPKEQHQ